MSITAKSAILVTIMMEQRDLPVMYFVDMDDDEIADAWDESEDEFCLQDALYEWRTSGEETNLNAPSSRHYESEISACETPFGWVAWVYWYGGGKHGNPEEIEWLDYARFVDCESKVITVTQHTFGLRDGEGEFRG